MDCEIYPETFGRGRNARRYWVIRDRAWGNKLVAKFTEYEFFHGGPDGQGVNDTQIIIDWMNAKKNNPEWQRFQLQKEIRKVKKMIDAM